MQVQPSAEPFSAAGGRTGVLLVHGFTGSPASMIPWGRSLAEEGFSVEVPRLPGHGTSWQELNRTRWTDWYTEASAGLDRLKSLCDEVFVCGLSMGGCLTLRLAQERPDDIAGLVLVNPSVISTRKDLIAVPLVKRFVPALKGIGNDIKMSGVDEHGYDRTPLKAVDSLRALWRITREDLPKVTVPLLLFRSIEDHVVEPMSAQIIMQRVSSRDVTERVLSNSYHVATLDNDAPAIFTETAEFIRKHSGLPDDSDAV
ncbi:MAG: alpha/beta hydrolase [Nocardioidaceae bacterium]